MKALKEIVFFKKFCILLLSIFTAFLIYIFTYPNEVCYEVLCSFLFYFLFKISFMWLIIFPIFFMQNMYNVWKKMLYVSLSLFILNIAFNKDIGYDFLFLSRTSMENIIPIVSFLFSTIMFLIFNLKSKVKK